MTISAQASAATGPLPYGAAAAWPLYLALGVLAGLAAGLYNRALLGAIAASERLGGLPIELKAGLVGAAVGVLAWFMPGLVGGGDQITQRLLSAETPLAMIALTFLVRFVLGAVSYAAATPGGLFAPMLVLGTQLGLIFGALCHIAFPHLDIEPGAFAVVGMAAFFTGVVQAPVTGIVLVTEMTAAFTTLLPMLGACFAAMLAANLVASPPIYDSLRERTIRGSRSAVFSRDTAEDQRRK